MDLFVTLVTFAVLAGVAFLALLVSRALSVRKPPQTTQQRLREAEMLNDTMRHFM